MFPKFLGHFLLPWPRSQQIVYIVVKQSTYISDNMKKNAVVEHASLSSLY